MFTYESLGIDKRKLDLREDLDNKKNINFLYDRFDGYIRYETGREGYTVVGQNQFENKFSSRDEEVLVHYWYARTQGVGIRLDFYESDVYNRNEIALQWMLKY